jgi:hypothetical protein
MLSRTWKVLYDDDHVSGTDSDGDDERTDHDGRNVPQGMIIPCGATSAWSTGTGRLTAWGFRFRFAFGLHLYLLLRGGKRQLKSDNVPNRDYHMHNAFINEQAPD